jgi:hypothetical protein
MPLYALQFSTASVHIEVTLTVLPKLGTKDFHFQDDMMREIGYYGPSIGFGIHFRVMGAVLGTSSSGYTKLEIGVLQSLIANKTHGEYRKDGIPPRYLRRIQPVLPIRDGVPGVEDVWLKPERKVEHLARILSRFPRQPFFLTVEDEVKSSTSIHL